MKQSHTNCWASISLQNDHVSWRLLREAFESSWWTVTITSDGIIRILRRSKRTFLGFLFLLGCFVCLTALSLSFERRDVHAIVFPPLCFFSFGLFPSLILLWSGPILIQHLSFFFQHRESIPLVNGRKKLTVQKIFFFLSWMGPDLTLSLFYLNLLSCSFSFVSYFQYPFIDGLRLFFMILRNVKSELYTLSTLQAIILRNCEQLLISQAYISGVHKSVRYIYVVA